MKNHSRTALLLLILFCAMPAVRAADPSESDTEPAATVIPVRPVEAPLPGQEPLSLDGCQWVWHPGDNATVAAPSIQVLFTGTIILPDNDRVARGEFLLHADDLFTLMVNGQPAGQGGLNGRIPNPTKPGDRQAPQSEPDPPPLLADMTGLLKPGTNNLMIRVINTIPSTPAGLIGRWRVRLTSGAIITGEIDRNWTARRSISKITVGVETLVPYRSAPWDRVPGSLPADGPFLGAWTLPDLPPDMQVRLAVDTPCPGMTATVNTAEPVPFEPGAFQVNITHAAREGENRVRIEPCAPARVRVELLPAPQQNVPAPEAPPSAQPAGS